MLRDATPLVFYGNYGMGWLRAESHAHFASFAIVLHGVSQHVLDTTGQRSRVTIYGAVGIGLKLDARAAVDTAVLVAHIFYDRLEQLVQIDARTVFVRLGIKSRELEYLTDQFVQSLGLRFDSLQLRQIPGLAPRQLESDAQPR